MTTILLFGAGKSATCLIDYLGKCCDENKWKLLVCDSNLPLVQSKTAHFSSAEAISFDVGDDEKRHEFISKANLVISMLPPALHFLVAKDCVAFSKDLLTASYIDEKIKSLKDEVEKKGILFLGEMGLDPGIDHMSAMKMINEIKNNGGKIISFKSHCGGLVSPESDDNPWHYKITWNPGNIVMAGAAGALYKINGTIKEIPYHEIFVDCEMVNVPGLFPLAWYPNRDSLSYISTYGLDDINTFIRTTLRHPAFCKGWNKIVNARLTEVTDYEEIKNCDTYKEWYELKTKASGTVLNNCDNEFSEQLNYLDLESNKKLETPIKNSAQLLQNILERKLSMHPHDKDMIVMLHEIGYIINYERKEIRSCLIVKGEDAMHTAMSKTVGLPLAIAAKLILQEKIKLTGLHIPVIPEIYKPVLAELEKNQIKFNEELTEFQ